MVKPCFCFYDFHISFRPHFIPVFQIKVNLENTIYHKIYRLSKPNPFNPKKVGGGMEGKGTGRKCTLVDSENTACDKLRGQPRSARSAPKYLIFFPHLPVAIYRYLVYNFLLEFKKEKNLASFGERMNVQGRR